VAPSTGQQCNLVTCDITRDQMCSVLARWRPISHSSCHSQIVYKLVYSRWICM